MEITLSNSEGITVVFSGNKYAVSRPKVKHIRKLRKVGANMEMDDLVSMLSECGLPESVSDELDPAQMKSVIEALMPEEKKTMIGTTD
jgi:hypothetical protein